MLKLFGKKTKDIFEEVNFFLNIRHIFLFFSTLSVIFKNKEARGSVGINVCGLDVCTLFSFQGKTYDFGKIYKKCYDIQPFINLTNILDLIRLYKFLCLFSVLFVGWILRLDISPLQSVCRSIFIILN